MNPPARIPSTLLLPLKLMEPLKLPNPGLGPCAGGGSDARPRLTGTLTSRSEAWTWWC
jgi:hypothetical protein